MKIILLELLLFNILLSSCNAQNNDSDLKLKAKTEAAKMFNSFVEEDYETFIELTYPPIVSMAGGEDAMIKILQKGIGPEVEVLKIEILSCSEMIKDSNNIQCSLKQKQIMSIDGQKLYTIGDLIGVSYDKGDSWVYLSVSSNTLEKVRSQFPEISNKLKVSPQTKPILID